YSTTAGAALDVAAPGVLANDSDPANTPLTPVLVEAPLNGRLALNPDGSFSYTPNSGFVGTDHFTYEVFNGTYSSAPVTDTIVFSPATTPPPSQPPTVTPLQITGIQGIRLTNAITASFTDQDPARTPSSFTATLNWGDGT